MGKQQATYRLHLFFSAGAQPQLIKAKFGVLHKGTGGWQETIRSQKTDKNDVSGEHFLWKQGTQGWVLALIAYRLGGTKNQGWITYGELGAASAANLIEKQQWLKSGFGSEHGSDEQVAERIFKPRKGRNYRVFSINSNLLPCRSVKFFFGENTKVLTARKIRNLAEAVRAQWTDHRVVRSDTANARDHMQHAHERMNVSDTSAQLSRTEDTDHERRYRALSRDGLYDQAMRTAEHALKRVSLTNDFSVIARWAARVASTHRLSGCMRESSAYYGRAWENIQRALAQAPDDFHLRHQAIAIRFGQIMVDDFMTRGALCEAERRYGQLFDDTNALIKVAPTQTGAEEVRIRGLNALRQQSEMIRLQGRYSRALKQIRAVTANYRKSDYEVRPYGKLAEADCLRLRGATKEAVDIYAEVEQVARERPLYGLLGATLWRQCGAFQCMGDFERVERARSEMEALATEHGARYGFVTLYSLLIRACGPVANADTASALLAEAKRIGTLRADHLAIEFAHCTLCEAELYRVREDLRTALTAFNKAKEIYVRIGCTWGIVRAFIGMRCCGAKERVPPALMRSAEGLDSKLLSLAEAGQAFAPGTLSMNLP